LISHIRPGLEICPDHADRPAPLLELQVSGKLADRAPHGVRRYLREREKLAGRSADALVVEEQPVDECVRQAV
jgi:hypothetical protein